MEPRKIENPVEAGREGHTSPPRQPERKRRFQIFKLEERVAPRCQNSTYSSPLTKGNKCH
jgi:hypothetical protein